MPLHGFPGRYGVVFGVVLGFLIGFGVARLLAGEPDLVLRIEPIPTPSVIVVYVTGAVERPGLYTVPSDARVARAVELARPREEADLASVPMAQRLRDGQTVEVPSVTPSKGLVTPATTGDPSAGELGASQRKIDVNRATAAELEQLPGIGPALARRIVAYREEHGPFRSLEELAEVPGISLRMVAEWGDLVTVGSPGE